MSNIQDGFPYNTNIYLFILFLIVLIIYQMLTKVYKYRYITSKVPTIYGLPFLGCIYKALPINKFLYNLGRSFEKLKSLTFFTWLGNQALLITVDPDIIKRILNSEEFLNKANVLYQSMDNALPNGIITSKVFKWKHNRKLMNPSFTPQILQRFVPIFNKGAQKISNHFEMLARGQEHSIFEYIQQTIMQIALETIMGIEIEKENKLEQRLVENFHKMLEVACLDTALSPLKLGFLVRTSSYYQITGYLKTYIKNLIFRKTEGNNYINESNDFFLNRALKYQEKGTFAADDTITETFTMISGSYETTSTTLYSLIVMLAMHSDVQKKLYQDVIKILPDIETNIEYEHLEQLPYLDMIIDETLRLMPPIPFIGRESLESCQLSPDIVVPRDFQILISIFHLHRHKELWGNDADKFNPDNFLPANKEKRHPYAYIPFSKGVRNCIGWRYAEISLKFMLLGLVRKYKFSTTFLYEDLFFIQKISLQYLKEPKIEIIKRH